MNVDFRLCARAIVVDISIKFAVVKIAIDLLSKTRASLRASSQIILNKRIFSHKDSRARSPTCALTSCAVSYGVIKATLRVKSCIATCVADVKICAYMGKFGVLRFAKRSFKIATFALVKPN